MANKEKMFRVLVIAISLKNNQIAHSKDEIAESLFSAPIDDLIKGGYIEEVSYDSKESEKEDAKLEEEEAKNAEANKTKTDESDKKDETASLGDIANSIPGAKANTAKK